MKRKKKLAKGGVAKGGVAKGEVTMAKLGDKPSAKCSPEIWVSDSALKRLKSIIDGSDAEIKVVDGEIRIR